MQILKSYHEIVTSEVKKAKEKIQYQITHIKDDAFKEISLSVESLDTDATFSKSFLPLTTSDAALSLQHEVTELESSETDKLSRAASSEGILYDTTGHRDYADISDDLHLTSWDSSKAFFDGTQMELRKIGSDESLNINALNLYGMFSGSSSPPNIPGIDEKIFGKIWPDKITEDEEAIDDQKLSISDTAYVQVPKRKLTPKLRKKTFQLTFTEKIISVGEEKEREEKEGEEKEGEEHEYEEEKEDLFDEFKPWEKRKYERTREVLFPKLTIYGADKVEIIDHQTFQLKETKTFDPLLVRKLREKQLTSDLCGSQPQSYIEKSSDLLPPLQHEKQPHQIDKSSSLLQFSEPTEKSPVKTDLPHEKLKDLKASPIISPYPLKKGKENNVELLEQEDDEDMLMLNHLRDKSEDYSSASSETVLLTDTQGSS